MDEQRDEFPVERIRGGGLGQTVFTAVVLVVALAVAIVKPWEMGGGGASASPGLALAPVATAEPTPAPSQAASLSPFDGPFGLVCYGGGAWELVMREVNGTTVVRTWYDLTPTPATGPADQTIRPIRVHSEGVLSLGYCTSSDTAGLLSIAGTTVWRLPGGSAAPIRLGAMRLSADSPSDQKNGSVFVPPRAADGTSAPSWATGRYVFEVIYAGPFASPSWFGVDIIDAHSSDLPASQQPTEPSGAPGAEGSPGPS